MHINHDANAAAVGEMIYGNAKGMKDFVMNHIRYGSWQRICVRRFAVERT